MTNKVALVTGAASGIGRATALAFAREGARVVVSDTDVDGGNQTVELIAAHNGDAIFVRTDVSVSAEVQHLVQQTIEKYGRLDYACNNAGIGGEAALTADYSEESWNRVIGINLTGVWLCMKYEIQHMLRQGGGSIVNMASILGWVGFQTAPAYVASKHALLGLTKNAAIEYGTQNIRVNAVCPAFIRTPLIEKTMSEEQIAQVLTPLHPIGRIGTPEEVAELVIWLCSDKASFVTGGAYLVDGGYVAR
jgi:NAD(P)-dependent dehydrogenase (short-subunit alcohol dehydrogenase family)